MQTTCSQDRPSTRFHGRLLARYQDQLLSRPFDDQLRLCGVAAATFVPAPFPRTGPGGHRASFRGRGWAIPHPLQPLGTLLLCVLSRHRATGPDGAPRVRHLFRGYSGRLSLITGQVHFGGSDQLIFAYDVGRPLGADGTAADTPPSFGTPAGLPEIDGIAGVPGVPELPGVPGDPGDPGDDTSLLALALDLDHACWSVAQRADALPRAPRLPPTVLAFAPTPGMGLRPERTQAVRRYAFEHHVPVEQAWRELEEQLRVPAELNPTALSLVDARLTRRRGAVDGQPGVLRVFHDLRPFLGPSRGRRVRNPAARLCRIWLHNPAPAVLRELGLAPAQVATLPPEQMGQLLQRCRERLGSRGVFFTDADLVRALTCGDRTIRPGLQGLADLRRNRDGATVTSALRTLLPWRLGEACTTDDLDRALAAPDRPMIASLLPRIDVWRVPEGNPAEAFAIEDATLGVCADLWGLNAAAAMAVTDPEPVLAEAQCAAA